MSNYGRVLWTDEKELLSRVAVRDELAFSKLFDRYQKRLYTFTLKLLKSDDLAAEVVQETFLKVWLMGERLYEIKYLEGFLVTTARNRSIDLLRQVQQQARLKAGHEAQYTEAHNETEEGILLRDTRKLIDEALATLPSQQRRVYQLCHLQGLRYEEAAEQLNISPLTVKTHMQHALRALRRRLGPHADLAVILLLFKIF